MSKIVFAFVFCVIFAIAAARPENHQPAKQQAAAELVESDHQEKDLKGSESVGYGYYGGLYPGYVGYPSYGYASYPSYGYGGYSSYIGHGYPYYGYSSGFGGLYGGHYW